MCAYKYLEFEIKFISNGVGAVLSTESKTCHKLVIGKNMPELSSIKLFQRNIYQYVLPNSQSLRGKFIYLFAIKKFKSM